MHLYRCRYAQYIYLYTYIHDLVAKTSASKSFKLKSDK